MNQVGFVVRGGAGSVERGSVSAEQDVTAIQASSGQEFSFNLRQSDIVAYRRSGSSLEITLADGRIILLEDYFDAAGQPVAKLYVSSDTYISDVTLVEGANGELYGQYGVAETWGKYGASDDLIFVDGAEVAHAAMAGEEDVSMLGAGILGGLGGVGTAAGVAAGVGVLGGISGGGRGPIEPSVNDTEIIIGGDDVSEEDQQVVITGTAEPGSDVEVTLGGQTLTVSPDDNGNWSAVFEGENFPADGNYDVNVSITTEGEQTELDGPSVTIDLTPPDLNVGSGVQANGHVVNAADYADGVDIAGTGEAGSTVSVTISGVTHETIVGEDGSWSVSFTTDEIAEGEYETDVTIVTTDSYGNSSTSVETLVVDTVSELTFSGANTGSDNIVNQSEHGDGVTLTGTTQPGSSVVVTLAGVEQAATVDANGNWSVTYAAGSVATGDYSADVSVVSTDPFGNVSSTTGTVEFDTLVENYSVTTQAGGSDGVVSGSESDAGITFGGTVEPGSSVLVSFGGIDRPASVDVNGNWSVRFEGGEIPESNGGIITMTAVATDAAGNSSTLTQDVTVDNVTGSLALSSAPIEGDNIVNAAEEADGVVVRGTSDPGNTVEVQLGGASTTVTTDANGNWTANFSASEVPNGQYLADIVATTTDAAGNSRTVTGSVEVDTEVRNLSVSTNDVTSDNVVNHDEREAGVTFSGTTEAGSTAVVVTIDGVSHNASVDANGNWSVTFPARDLPSGEGNYALNVDVTDRAGNIASTSRTVEFDTLVNALSGGAVEEGGTAVFNAADVSDGITVEGAVEAGSTVSVVFGGQTYTASVDARGNWSVDLPPSAFTGEAYEADIVVNVTDAAGNTASLTQTIEIDADVPDAPEIDGYTRDHTGYSAVQVVDSDDAQTIYEVDGTSVTQMATDSDGIAIGANNYYGLNPSVQDGSHLVVSATDAAGNVSSTFMALDDPASSDLDMTSVNPGLAGLEIEAVDLTFAEDTNLTLSLGQIEAFAAQSDTLAIRGGSDDTVTITGATRTGTSVSENGETYDVYTMGDHTVLIDDDVNTVI